MHESGRHYLPQSLSAVFKLGFVTGVNLSTHRQTFRHTCGIYGVQCPLPGVACAHCSATQGDRHSVLLQPGGTTSSQQCPMCCNCPRAGRPVHIPATSADWPWCLLPTRSCRHIAADLHEEHSPVGAAALRCRCNGAAASCLASRRCARPLPCPAVPSPSQAAPPASHAACQR